MDSHGRIHGRKWGICAALVAAGVTFPAIAAPAPQDTAPQCWIVKAEQAGQPPELACADDIVVTAADLRGRIIAPVEPLLVLGADDVTALGAFSVGEILQRLETTTSSPRGGATVVLLNGMRVSGMEEVQGLPPEAIERIDVLPEDAAKAYGYDGSQRVTNIVLKRRFQAATLDGSASFATDGNRLSRSATAGFAKVSGQTRTTLNATYQRSDALLEADRGIVLPAGTASDMRRYRTLLPATDKLSLEGSLARPIAGIATSLTSSLELSRSDNLYGLPTIALQVPASSPFAPDGLAGGITRMAGPERVQRGRQSGGTAKLGFVSTAGAGDWLLTLQGNFEHGWSRTAIDRGLDPSPLQAAVDAGGDPYQALSPQLTPDLGASRSNIEWTEEQLYLSANAPIATLPAGRITVESKLGVSRRTAAQDVGDPADALSRTRTLGQVFVSVPLSQKKVGFLSFLGGVEANFMALVERYSDVGLFFTGGPGITWQPTKTLSFYFSHFSRPTAPTVEQLREGVRTIPAIAAFDYRTGDSVLISQIEGGNAALRSEFASAPAVFAAWQPLKGENLRITASYMTFRRRHPIVAFPVPNAEIERAFPDRFVRDANGRLLSVDARPINLERSQSDTISTSITWNKVLGAPPAKPPDDPAGAALAPPPRKARTTRLILGLRHTWRLKEIVEIEPGLRPLDLLDGDAIGRSGGLSTHEVKFQGSVARGPLTANLDLTWRSGSRLNLGNDPVDRLTFAPVGKADISLQYDFGKADPAPKSGLLAKTMIRLDVSNLTNARPHVRDGTGATPLFYQPAYLDPLGRNVTVRLRKQF